MPRLPADDRLETQKLTVASLAADCAEFAELDEAFLNRDRTITSVTPGWETQSGTSWRVGFTAMHCYENKRYVGQSYALQITVAQRMSSFISRELKEWAADAEVELPDEEHIHAVIVTHAATYLVSQYVTLGWNSHREYEIDHDQASLYNLEVESEESEDEHQDNEAIKHPRPMFSITLGQQLEYRDAPEISLELALGDSYITADVEMELIDCLDTEMHLKLANDALTVLQTNSEGDFDLSTVFPPDILERLNQD